MNVIFNTVIGAVQNTVSLLNQPIVKENVKKVAGTVTFFFGLIETFTVYEILSGRKISNDVHFSLILSAAVSPPGIYIISSVAKRLFSEEQLTSAFGPNTIFAVNPKHPRHVASIGAVVLALPTLVRSESTPPKFLMTLFNTVTSRPVLHVGNQICFYFSSR